MQPLQNQVCSSLHLLHFADVALMNCQLNDADHLAVCRTLLLGYAPTLSSIPSRLERLRGSLQSKFGCDLFNQYCRQVKKVVFATTVSTNDRESDRLLSMLNADTLQYLALFVQLVQLETLTGVA